MKIAAISAVACAALAFAQPAHADCASLISTHLLNNGPIGLNGGLVSLNFGAEARYAAFDASHTLAYVRPIPLPSGGFLPARWTLKDIPLLLSDKVVSGGQPFSIFVTSSLTIQISAAAPNTVTLTIDGTTESFTPACSVLVQPPIHPLPVGGVMMQFESRNTKYLLTLIKNVPIP